MIIIILLSLVVTSSSDETCKENEEFRVSGGRNPTCGDMIIYSESQCVCKEGFVIDHNGKCINSSECPQNPCNENEEFLVSGGYNPTCGDIIIYSESQCVCKDGFVVDDNGECIHPSECPQIPCKENEAFYVRGGINPTCGDFLIYSESQCVCKKGFVIDDNGKCIHSSECPQIRCGENEVPMFSGGYEYTCTLDIVYSNGSPCLCKDGFARENGICINQSECPGLNCKENERYNYEGTYDPPCGISLEYAMCVCKDGFVRQNGTCISEALCLPIPCKENEEFRVSGGYNPTCGDILIYSKSQCVCKDGFVVDDNGECIHPSKCP